MLRILVAAGLAAAALGVALPGGERVLARGSGEVLRLEARADGVLWLEAAGGSEAGAAASPRLLFLPRGASRPRVLAESPEIVDFSAADAVYYVTASAPAAAETPARPAGGRTGSVSPLALPTSARAPTPGSGRGALLRIAFQGGDPVVEETGLSAPTAVFAGRRWICWTETRGAPPLSLSVLPLTRPLVFLRARLREARVATTLSVSDSATIRLLGEMDGDLLWAEQRVGDRAASLIRRARMPDSGGTVSVETLASEEGLHEGVAVGGALYWTGASREGAPPRAFASANRLAPDGRVELLGEWLAPGGVLRADGDRVFYCREGVHALPGNAGVARELVMLDGPGRLTQIVGGNAYVAARGEGRAYRIVRRPLDWAGRWAARRGAVP